MDDIIAISDAIINFIFSTMQSSLPIYGLAIFFLLLYRALHSR